jgi:hypothetical protein
MVAVKQSVQDVNTKTHMRLRSGVCVVRIELTEILVPYARQ